MNDSMLAFTESFLREIDFGPPVQSFCSSTCALVDQKFKLSNEVLVQHRLLRDLGVGPFGQGKRNLGH